MASARILRRWDIACALLLVASVGLPASLAVLEMRQRQREWYRPARFECHARLELLRLALWEYQSAHGGRLPADLAELGPLPAPLSVLVTCPVRSEGVSRGLMERQPGPDYVYAGKGLDVHKLANPRTFPILFDRAGNHPDGTRTVVFADCHTDKLTEAEFAEATRQADADAERLGVARYDIEQHVPESLQQAGERFERCKPPDLIRLQECLRGFIAASGEDKSIKWLGFPLGESLRGGTERTGPASWRVGRWSILAAPEGYEAILPHGPARLTVRIREEQGHYRVVAWDAMIE